STKDSTKAYTKDSTKDSNKKLPTKEIKPPPNSKILKNELSKPAKIITKVKKEVAKTPILIKYYNNIAWIDNLINNLENNNYVVSINVPKKINQVILVITSKALESGWVQTEYQYLLAQQQLNPKLKFIPIINQNLTTFPFISQQKIVNFNTTNYLNAFKQLLTNLNSNASINNLSIKLPSKTTNRSIQLISNMQTFIEQLFQHFEQNSPPPLMLLAQMDRLTPQIVASIETEGQKLYQNYLHIALPYTMPSDNTLIYYNYLAQQCGFNEAIHNNIEFERAIQTRLKDNMPLFLFISSFENGTTLLQKQLVGICRNLYESYSKQIHIMLLGGENLAQLKYKNSHTSLLNIAKDLHLPEMKLTDIYNLTHIYSNLNLTDKTVDILLELSGGHPILLKRCLNLYQTNTNLVWQQYPHILSKEPLIQAIFSNLITSKEIELVRNWLSKTMLMPAISLYSYSHQYNKLLQYLYWKNLLLEKEIDGKKNLYWRCEAIRLAGQIVLK
ncbi:MAG: toll/interleukin-1 receptor domain-containing protein, partial [Thiomargarita sp.]|nr:toll/interleukin-1 receptor domain-containing protein [Thiomargarita sp.]